jgi:hypothetical protein
MLVLLASACGNHLEDLMAENAEEGAESPEWDVNGAGDPSIQGFADASSYRGGENVILRVKTDAVHAPRLRISQK